MARKILLADDSVTAQNMGRKILTDAGYEVVTVNNGSAALKKIAEGTPDLIVLDVYMPGYSGLEVCQRIKENRETARIPVLLTVGKLEPFKPEEARRARADAFVVKPFEASELLSALTKLEDKIIPGAEPYKQGRFAKAIASVDQEPDGEKFGDSEGGWKARLRIPTGKPKEKDPEPDPDYAATQGKGFRDLPEPATKKNTVPAPPVASAMPERPLPTGIPHDITPEEIAAITAAAAQLNGASPAPVVESHEPQLPESSAVETAQEMVAQENTPENAHESAPVTFASSPVFEEPVEEAGNVQMPAVPPLDSPQPDAVAETVAAEPVPIPIEARASAPVATVEAIAEEPAVPAATPPESSVEAVVEATPVPVTETEESHVVSPVVQVPEVVAADVPPATPEPTPEFVASPPATTSDDEVMAALQTLIPTSESATVGATDPSNGTGTAYPAHSAHPRWIAEEVGLAVDEATISLEQEMAAAYSTFSGQAPHSAESDTPHAVVAQAESTVTAAAPIEQPPVEALASAAAVGEGASAYSTVTAHVSPEFSATERSAEITTSTSDVSSPVASSTAEPVPEEIPNLEGEVMAASWKNIRDSIAGAAAKPATTKEEFRDVEPASTDSNPSPSAAQNTPQFKASDPTAIANIVDSVLAELRPKIVEEIARKLSDSKKE